MKPVITATAAILLGVGMVLTGATAAFAAVDHYMASASTAVTIPNDGTYRSGEDVILQFTPARWSSRDGNTRNPHRAKCRCI